MWTVKAMTDKIGKLDTKALAAAWHGATILAKDYPGVLFDTHYDTKGDLERESFFVKVANGRAQVIQTFRPSLAAPK
jgi:branched-chain amino acid transport system substrate-binding protein